MELACEVAKADPSPAVVNEVVQSFSFRGADSFLNELMNTAPDAEEWTAVASNDYPETLPDPALNERLTTLRSRNPAEQSPDQALRRLLLPSGRSDDANEQIVALLKEEAFSFFLTNNSGP